jgi:hypothetical protein
MTKEKVQNRVQAVQWPKSQSFVHVDEQGTLSSALTEQFLPARAALLNVVRTRASCTLFRR